MIYVEWLVLIVASWLVDAVGLFVVPIAIACSDGTKLPQWARWWDNDREPLGDELRKAAIDAAVGFRRGWLRYCWLALRNPGNNFGYAVGFVQSPDVVYEHKGDALTSDQGHPGTLFVRAYRDFELAGFCFYGVWRWSSSRCLRIFVGWKIHDTVKDGKPAQIVCVFNPFMTFTGAQP